MYRIWMFSTGSSCDAGGESRGAVGDLPMEGKEHLGEEMSDALLSLVRLADVRGVDLSTAVLKSK